MLGLTKTCPIDVNQSLDEGPRLLQAGSPEVDHDQLSDLDCLPEPLESLDQVYFLDHCFKMIDHDC